MAAGQKSESGAKTSLDDEKIRKEDIPSNRDKAQRRPGQSVDGKEVQAEGYKDTPTNQRPPEGDHGIKPDQSETGKTKKIDRPGFDLGGATGDTSAGKGLGLGKDAKEGRKGWGLPVQPSNQHNTAAGIYRIGGGRVSASCRTGARWVS